MTTYLLPKAVNVRTGQTVKQQDLTGGRFTLAQRALCEEQANQLAAQMTVRTREPWQAQVIEYEPVERQSS